MEDSSIHKKIKNYNFLPNQPLGEDLFKNKSQDKIADIISQNVINDPNFKIIGIDGTWGSGKSNLVHLIEKKLVSTHKFFIYDVWGHQEDEQRKSMLVELTEFINGKELLKQGKKNWENKLDELLANTKRTTTINQPYLSIGFIFSLLSIIYIPTVNVFKDSMTDFFHIESLFWKIVLVAFPILIVIGIYLYYVVRNWINKEGCWKSFRIAAEETFQVYTNKQKKETKSETISENQPSVRDFQNWMDEIDKDLKEKIVIVFDNFDRLPKKYILNIWSSIHIFFAEKKYKNIKVILPFDREHLQNAFKDLNGGDDQTFCDDYVNKTFDIVFRITLPSMSNWKDFFANQWKNAFTEYDEDELKLVIQVYEFLNRRITPREIISFINEILTIKILDEKIKERYISIFILKKSEILKDPLKAITNFEYLGGLKSLYQNDPEFPKQLTAIVFHVEEDNALELIYTEELKDSLNKNDVEQFNTICKSEFIDTIFTKVILELEILENPIKTLSKLNKESKLSSLHINQAWKTLYYKALGKELKIDNLEMEEWQLLLIQKYPDDKYLQNLLNQYVTILDETNTLEYVTLIDIFFDEVGQDRVSPLILTKKINAENFVKIIEQKGKDYKKYKLTSDSIEIDNFLSKLKIEQLLKLKNTDILNQDFTLNAYKNLLKINLNTYVDQNNIQLANNTLIKLKETCKNNADLKDILDDVKINNLYVNNSSSTLPIISELIAMRIAKGQNFNASYANTFKPLLDKEDKQLATEISSTILNYIKYDDLLLQAKFFTNSNLYRKVAINLIEDNETDKRGNVLKLVNKYKEIKKSLEIESDQLLKELDNWLTDKSEINIDDLDDEFIIDCFKYRDIELSALFIEKFNEDFKNSDEDLFKVVFGDGNNIYFKFFKYLNSESLTQTSLDVFQNQLFIKIKEGKTTNQWWEIFEKYESNNTQLSIVNVLKNLRDQFLHSNLDLTIETANIFLPYFIKYDLLGDTTDIFRTIIKNTFLTNDAFNNILLTNYEYVKSLYQNSSQDERDGFRHTINEKREEFDSLNKLAKFIGIKKSDKKTDD
jgi:hypothetical protein